IILFQSWNRFILHQLHYEILETRKRKALEQKQRHESPHHSKDYFVYKEQDFPSILGQIHSRLNPRLAQARGEKTQGKDEEEEGKYLWIASSTAEGNGWREGKTDTAGEVLDEETDISQLFGIKQIHVHKCLKCCREVSKESVQLLCNLVYPNTTSGKSEYNFDDILLKSLCPEQTTPAWCDFCDKYQPTLQSRKLKALPNILAINCGLDSLQV
ncbi:unnamed protein product, partial [Timema podura]|nr:unnamed protein product [Timema podura]